MLARISGRGLVAEGVGMITHCWWECKILKPLWKLVWRFLKKAVPLLAIYLKECKSAYRKDTCITMFIAAILTIAK
jgi:hypothetical protein